MIGGAKAARVVGNTHALARGAQGVRIGDLPRRTGVALSGLKVRDNALDRCGRLYRLTSQRILLVLEKTAFSTRWSEAARSE